MRNSGLLKPPAHLSKPARRMLARPLDLPNGDLPGVGWLCRRIKVICLFCWCDFLGCGVVLRFGDSSITFERTCGQGVVAMPPKKEISAVRADFASECLARQSRSTNKKIDGGESSTEYRTAAKEHRKRHAPSPALFGDGRGIGHRKL